MMMLETRHREQLMKMLVLMIVHFARSNKVIIEVFVRTPKMINIEFLMRTAAISILQ